MTRRRRRWDNCQSSLVTDSTANHDAMWPGKSIHLLGVEMALLCNIEIIQVNKEKYIARVWMHRMLSGHLSPFCPSCANRHQRGSLTATAVQEQQQESVRSTHLHTIRDCDKDGPQCLIRLYMNRWGISRAMHTRTHRAGISSSSSTTSPPCLLFDSRPPSILCHRKHHHPLSSSQ